MKIYHDQVIEAAYLHTTPRCFYVGPFARRVSFASQQYRAFDLVSAFAEKGLLSAPPGKKSLHVAVIGAGIAGLTLASALRGRECKVDLYESNSKPLELQRKAHHRLVHPTISRWPTGPFELTTDFEFLRVLGEVGFGKVRIMSCPIMLLHSPLDVLVRPALRASLGSCIPRSRLFSRHSRI